jgi:hypothetical protein
MERIHELPIKDQLLRIGVAAPIYPPSVGPEGMGTRWLTRT